MLGVDFVMASLTDRNLIGWGSREQSHAEKEREQKSELTAQPG
jgi:hypothetical protein